MFSVSEIGFSNVVVRSAVVPLRNVSPTEETVAAVPADSRSRTTTRYAKPEARASPTTDIDAMVTSGCETAGGGGAGAEGELLPQAGSAATAPIVSA